MTWRHVVMASTVLSKVKIESGRGASLPRLFPCFIELLSVHQAQCFTLWRLRQDCKFIEVNISKLRFIYAAALFPPPLPAPGPLQTVMLPARLPELLPRLSTS